MQSSDEKAAQAALNVQLVRAAVTRGDGREAKRLADQFRIPNIMRMELGVELSDDPKLKKPLTAMS